MKITKWSLTCVSLLVLTVGVSRAIAQSAATTQPRGPDVKAALHKCELAEAKAKAEYDKAVLVARTELLKDLKAAMEAATKAGDLDEAIAIRDKVKELQAVLTPHVAPVPVAPPPVAPGAMTPAIVVGGWNLWKPSEPVWWGQLHVYANNTYFLTDNNGSCRGAWRIEGKEFGIDRGNGWETYIIDPKDGVTLDGHTTDKAFTAVRGTKH